MIKKEIKNSTNKSYYKHRYYKHIKIEVEDHLPHKITVERGVPQGCILFLVLLLHLL